MDKGAFHPLDMAVDTGDAFPGSRAGVSLLSRLVLAPASLLHPAPANAGAEPMRILATPTGAAPTNVYCAGCLRTRRFHDRSTHLSCETCGRRLEKAPPVRVPGAGDRRGGRPAA
jgi:hypothetical protein